MIRRWLVDLWCVVGGRLMLCGVWVGSGVMWDVIGGE